MTTGHPRLAHKVIDEQPDADLAKWEQALLIASDYLFEDGLTRYSQEVKFLLNRIRRELIGFVGGSVDGVAYFDVLHQVRTIKRFHFGHTLYMALHISRGQWEVYKQQPSRGMLKWEHDYTSTSYRKAYDTAWREYSGWPHWAAIPEPASKHD